jgi:hypothetical protein
VPPTARRVSARAGRSRVSRTGGRLREHGFRRLLVGRHPPRACGRPAWRRRLLRKGLG